MARPRIRALPSSASSPRPKPPPRTTLTVDGLGLHRLTRQAIRDLHERVGQLGALVGLLDSISAETFAGDDPDQLRASSTIMKAACREVASTTIEVAMQLGALRFIAALRALEIE